MPPKLCKICEKIKDSKEDFYAKSGRVCSDCKSQQSAEHAKAVGGKVIEMLEAILKKQHSMDEKLEQLEEELTKMRRRLKRTSA